MDYFLFVLLTATLFLRPGELVPELAGLPIYNYTILACLVASGPKIVDSLQWDALRRRPISLCVLGILVAAAFSHLVRLDLWTARHYSIDLAKVLVFYLLIIVNLYSLARLRNYLYWVAVLTVILSAIAVGHFLEFYQLEALEALREWDYDPQTGERFVIYRLQATGIFNDPNDLSMIVVVSMCICGMGVLDRFGGLTRFLWLAPLGFLGYTLILTQSRGGFLAMMVAALSLFYSRYGLRKGLIAGATVLPLLAVAFGGRQTDLSGALSGGTGHSRVELWSEGLQLLKGSPVFGIGFRKYAEEAGQVAHNSYVHSLVELGIVGGATFLGAFWLSTLIMWRLGSQRRAMTILTGSPRLAQIQPFLIAILAGYMVSMLSLSRCYVIPTYLILGLMTAYQQLVEKKGIRANVELNGREMVRILALSVGFVVLTYVYIRVGFR